MTAAQQAEIVTRATVKRERGADLAAEYGISRQGVIKILKRHGVNTAKGLGGICWVDCACDRCGKSIKVRRGYWRQRRKHYCGTDCYHAALTAGPRGSQPYVKNRQSQRVARATISRYYTLPAGAVVHHIDRNDRHGDISNLQAFASNADHMGYHRGADVQPIWDGKTTGLLSMLLAIQSGAEPPHIHQPQPIVER